MKERSKRDGEEKRKEQKRQHLLGEHEHMAHERGACESRLQIGGRDVAAVGELGEVSVAQITTQNTTTQPRQHNHRTTTTRPQRNNTTAHNHTTAKQPQHNKTSNITHRVNIKTKFNDTERNTNCENIDTRISAFRWQAQWNAGKKRGFAPVFAVAHHWANKVRYFRKILKSKSTDFKRQLAECASRKFECECRRGTSVPAFGRAGSRHATQSPKQQNMNRTAQIGR
jgi:hypothetical protein